MRVSNLALETNNYTSWQAGLFFKRPLVICLGKKKGTGQPVEVLFRFRV